MSYEFYKLLHLGFILLLFLALGGLLYVDPAHKKLLSILHGTALVVILVSGFGLLARLGAGGVPNWAIVKIVLWLFLGGVTVFIKKSPHAKMRNLILIAVPGALAAIFAVLKPF